MASNATATTALDTAVPVESVLNEEMNTDTAVTQEQPAVPTGQNFVDENGDGICDTCGNVPGSGMGNQYGKGAMGSNFVDEDGDGVCDTCSLAPADGTGNQYGRQGGQGGQGRGGRWNN
jgi:hypothetical protein